MPDESLTPADPRTILIFGSGVVGGAVLDLLALRYPHHRYILAARNLERTTQRVNLTRYVSVQWGRFPRIDAATAELLDIDRTAEVIDHYRPDVVFNATTPFPWWALDAMPRDKRDLSYSAGLGMWCALDCVLPLRLAAALAVSRSRAVYVNGCYPDMVNPFLANEDAPPLIGIGNISNLIPGLRLAFGGHLAQGPEQISVKLICHHSTSLNAPSVGGASGLPYHLQVDHAGGRLIYHGVDDTPFALLKEHATRVRGLDGQGVTVSSAATVLATLLNGQRRRHHVPGPLGRPGGYPILITEHGQVDIDLPDGLDLADAVAINEQAQQRDGIAAAKAGLVSLTDVTSDALRTLTGVTLTEVDVANVLPVAREIVAQLNARYGLRLRL
ncbi:hypothetical protein [Plantactinospora sp. KBS50]|uniref:hypothetical protein n=1 Tax=Plantactinospora sp. KBS50 TaxID=2024580 RepID=UPI000BAAEE1B|nr:hypothetical protein [Plantactinospora sp. KBS50]ASW55795.1 hypothetical protein CIK06_18845 [Plantactinospora sp. KBS50]